MWTATALLARAFLYVDDWQNAEIQATNIINNTTLYSLPTNLDNVFLKNSTETIWQLMPLNTGSAAIQGRVDDDESSDKSGDDESSKDAADSDAEAGTGADSAD
jgi:hypothetical protein